MHELVVDFKQSWPDWDGKSDIFPRSSKTDHEKNQRLVNVLEDYHKRWIIDEMEIDTMEFIKFRNTMDQNGINVQNAYQELRRRQMNPNYEVSLRDAYIMLFSFIVKHRKDHIFVDEFSILHSPFCKFNLNLANLH